MKKPGRKEYLKLGKRAKGQGQSKRRRKIKRKLEEKLVESEFERREIKEKARHGSLKVREIETLDGTEMPGAVSEEFRPRPEPFEPGEFFILVNPEELKRIEESLASAYPKSRELLAAIEKDAGIELFEAQIRTIEEEVGELLEAYGIDSKPIRKRAEEKGAKRLGAETEKLLDLIELDRKLSKELLYKPGKPDPGLPYFERQKERVIEIAEHAEAHFLIFDAALAYAFVAIAGKTSIEVLGENLGFGKERAKACVEVLKKQGLVKAKKTHGKGEELSPAERKPGKKGKRKRTTAKQKKAGKKNRGKR